VTGLAFLASVASLFPVHRAEVSQESPEGKGKRRILVINSKEICQHNEEIWIMEVS
jgi:hypothetical protein